MAKTDPPPDAAPPAVVPAGPAPQAWRYVDTQERTYLFPGFGPQSAQYADVCALPYDPGDRRWQKTGAAVTRLPDNHPDQIEADAGRAANERARLLASPAYRPQPAVSDATASGEAAS